MYSTSNHANNGSRIGASDNLQAVGMGSCPLVLGECVQGRLAMGPHFLITSPIGLFSWAEFAPSLNGGPLLVDPPERTKALRAVSRYLSEQDLPANGVLRVSTPIDPGQGFGTSTADIAASLRAAASAWRRVIGPGDIARIAVAIEPTDGSMYRGCVAFAHRDGVPLESLGQLPRFEALVACTGGVVDTVEFDRRRKDFRYPAHEEAELTAAWNMIRHANRLGDVGLMARASTISAKINEQLLRKPYFAEMVRFAECAGVDGIMAAHSGTALALILDPMRPGFHDRLREARAFLDDLELPAWFQISNYAQRLGPASSTPARRVVGDRRDATSRAMAMAT